MKWAWVEDPTAVIAMLRRLKAPGTAVLGLGGFAAEVKLKG